MRCTKCHYLSFEPEPRCKNCGHDLSLEDGAPFDRADNDHEDFATVGQSYGSGRTAGAVMAPANAKPAIAATSAANRIPTSELPLFVQSMQGVSDQLAGFDSTHQEREPELEDLAPLVKVPARPRNPVSVRRATPDPAKLRAKYGLSPEPEPDLWSNLPPDPIDSVKLHDEVDVLQELDLHMPSMKEPAPEWPGQPDSEPRPATVPAGWDEAAWDQSVGAGTRLVSAAIDGALIASIAVTVLYLTLQVAGLSVSQIGLLPVLPFVGLLLLVTVGYLWMFTASSGQTVGKMAMNIRVVGTSPEAVMTDRISVSQAAVRTFAAVPSVLMLGLGFAPSVVGSGPAVHDRIAHTRVVRL